MTGALFDLDPPEPAPDVLNVRDIGTPPAGLGQDALRTWRQRSLIERGIHPVTRAAVKGDGGTCGDCRFLYLKSGDFAGSFWKCGVVKTRILDSGPYWTNGKPLSRLIQSMRNMAAALADHDANTKGRSMSTEPSTIPCGNCDGCGQVANSDDQEPWTAWTSLPPQSQGAIRMGLVAPIPCPRCRGKGVLTVEVVPDVAEYVEPAEPFTFLLNDGEPLTVETAVYQALGAASVCWDNLAGAGMFHSDRAKEIGDALLAVIREQRVSA